MALLLLLLLLLCGKGVQCLRLQLTACSIEQMKMVCRRFAQLMTHRVGVTVLVWCQDTIRQRHIRQVQSEQQGKPLATLPRCHL